MEHKLHALWTDLADTTHSASHPDGGSDRYLRWLPHFLGASYLIVCTIYILISGEIALRLAHSPEQLFFIERLKGILFIVFSSFIFYIIARVLVARIRLQQAKLEAHRGALLEAQARAAAGLMAASVAHDIKNVLTLFNFHLYRLDKAKTQPIEQEAVVHQMEEAVERLNRLALGLLALSKNHVGDLPERLNLTAVVQENVDFIRLHQTVRSCKVTYISSEPLELPLRRGLIDQMVINLLINAAEAVGGKGQIEVRAYRDGDEALIEVHDDGRGVANENSDALFDAFYTTKSSGHGLGLYTVKACAELHQGKVNVGMSHLGGACFQVRLPMPRHMPS